MLYFLLVWGLLLGISFITGLSILSRFQVNGFNRAGQRFFISSWLGLVVLANVFLGVALIIPLSPLVGLLILGSSVIYPLSVAKLRIEAINILINISDRWLLLSAYIAVGTAIFTTQQVSWFDTGLYHFGSIRWIADYGSVPGVALLNSGFAFVSSWFALAAPFNPAFLGSRNTAVLNGYLVFLLLLQASLAVHYILTKTAAKSDWFIVIYSLLTLPLFIFTPFLSAVLISPSPDLPVILVTGIMAWTILEFSEQRVHHANAHQADVTLAADLMSDNYAIVTLLLGIGAVTFKLNGLPILGIAVLYYAFHHWRKPFSLALGAGITLLLLSPMFLFGIVTSGCPLYPSSWMCVSVPWVLSSQQAANALNRINGWQNWFGTPPSDANVWLWTFSQWLQLSHMNKAMVFLAILAIPITIWIFKRARTQHNTAEVWIIALSLLGMGFIFSQAPLIRFGLGYFILLPTLIIATLCIQIGEKMNKLLPSITKLPKATGLSILFVITLIFFRYSEVKLDQQLVIPPELPAVKVNSVKVNDVDYFLPESTNKCWGAELPCVPERLEADIWLRQPEQGVAAGFRRK